ncbi:MAG: hypothetical protein HKO02_11390 [Hyphomonadaceae bacterium]|nr:hypothetical protein [Hyphomonadaceae bacterium]
MTKDELEDLILRAKNPKKIAAAFSGMDEKDRKVLSTHAQRLLKQLENSKADKLASPRLAKHINSRKGEVWSHWHKPDTVNARLSVLAAGPLSAVKRMHFYWGDELWAIIDKIIVDRKPAWLDDWIAHDLEQEFSSISFYRIWAWMKDGICKQPDVDGFYVRFANYMMSTGFYDKGPGVPISKALNKEPELKEFVWSLFRIESNAFNTNSWFKKGAADDHETWTEALINMSIAGDLDRQRLLDASLDGLWTDLKQNQLSGFHKFHKALKPTPEERSARQSAYLTLLSHSVGHVIKFGLDNASALEKAKLLDVDAFLAEVPNVFLQDGKGNAVAAVKLMGRILKSQPKKAKAVLAVLPDALRHQNADVQKLALEIIGKNTDLIDGDIRSSISDAADFVSASVRSQLAPYLDVEPENELDQEAETEIEIDTQGLDVRQKKALRINEILRDGPFEYWPVSQNILDHNVLNGLEKLKPIEDEDELISAISHAVEVIDSPNDIERIVDGISRCADPASGDFKDKTAPLLLRIEKKRDSDSQKGLRYYGNVSAAIMDLIYTWLTKKHHKSPQKKFEKHVTALIPAALYIREITARVQKNQPRGLLTFPTHSNGWIDPIIWVERLAQFEKDDVQLSEYEVSLSVLRLAPENRDKALKKVSDLAGDIGRLARFALGGDDRPTAQDKKRYGMWVSASRCREPYGGVSELLTELKLKDKWPGGLQPAEYHWRPFTESQKSHFGDETYHFSRLDIQILAKGSMAQSEQKSAGLLPKLKNLLTTEWERMPTAAPNARTRQKYYWGSELNAIYLSQWLSFQWPQCPSTAHITGVENLLSRIDEDSSSWEPNFGFLNALFQRGRPWDEPAHLLLCMALAGKDADAKGLAIDTMIEGIEAGLFDVDICAGVLIKLASGGWLKLNRLGDNLMTVAETSPLHAAVIGSLVQKWIQNVDLKQRYIFRMFEVLLEAQSMVRQALDSNTSEALKTLKGSSKAAKTAKSLISLKDHSTPDQHMALKQAAIAGRVS